MRENQSLLSLHVPSTVSRIPGPEKDAWSRMVLSVVGNFSRSKNNFWYFQNETRIENVQWEKWKSSKCKFYPWLIIITHQLWVIINESYLQYQFNKEDMTRCNSQYIADTYTKSGFQTDASIESLSTNQIKACVGQSEDDV